MKHFILGLCLLVLSAIATPAQSTYTLNKPFTCDASGYYAIESFSEFTCRVHNPLPQNYYGIVSPNYILTDCPGETAAFIPANCQAEVYLWASLPRLYVITPQFEVVNATFHLTSFTDPGSRQGATWAIAWQGTDANNTPHNGTLVATWGFVKICGGKSCWWHPVLDTSTLTVSQ